MKNKIIFLVFAFAMMPMFVFAQTNDEVVLPDAGVTPESLFYFLDMWSEGVESFFTFNAEAKARLQVKFAEERVFEIKVMLETKGVEAKGILKAQERLAKHKAKAVALVDSEKQKGIDVKDLASDVSDSFHAQKKAIKAIFDAAKETFKQEKSEIKIALIAAIEAGDIVRADELRAQLLVLEAEKDVAETQKDAAIDALEEEKGKLKDALDHEKRQADELRDSAESARDEVERIDDEREELEDKAREEELDRAEKAAEEAEKAADNREEGLKIQIGVDKIEGIKGEEEDAETGPRLKIEGIEGEEKEDAE